MKLQQIKQTYKVNGVEYASLKEAKKAIGITSNENLKNKKTIKSQLINDICNYKFSEYMGKMSLIEAESLATRISNKNIKFWVPNHLEMNYLVQNGKINEWKEDENYWTSSVFKFSTYIFYNTRLKQFDDIFPDTRLGIRFLFKED